MVAAHATVPEAGGRDGTWPPIGTCTAVSKGAAREAGILPHAWSTNGAFRTAKHRAAKDGIPVPPVRGKKGSEAMYDAVELADFLERITERQAA